MHVAQQIGNKESLCWGAPHIDRTNVDDICAIHLLGDNSQQFVIDSPPNEPNLRGVTVRLCDDSQRHVVESPN
eukprot:3303307-Lingulodinium_polyedra.AAC.1